MRRSLAVAALAAGLMGNGAGLMAQVNAQKLVIERWGETIVLEPYAPNIVRVTLSMKKEPALAGPGYGFVASPAAAGWTASETEQANVYSSSRLVASIDKPQPSNHAPSSNSNPDPFRDRAAAMNC